MCFFSKKKKVQLLLTVSFGGSRHFVQLFLLMDLVRLERFVAELGEGDVRLVAGTRDRLRAPTTLLFGNVILNCLDFKSIAKLYIFFFMNTLSFIL